MQRGAGGQLPAPYFFNHRNNVTVMDTRLTGIHHVSSLTADAARNYEFYTHVLGMRLVKKTVNQDDPSMYHLFYGDGVGSVGTGTTFFDFPHASRVPEGNNSITRLTHRVAGETALNYWADRLSAHDVEHEGVTSRDGRLVLDFEDPDSTHLSLIDDGGAGKANPWDKSPVPAEHQIRGLGYPFITVPELAPTDEFLTEGLQMHPVRQYPYPEAPGYRVHVYEMAEGGPSAEVHVVVRNDLSRARRGAGSTHHVALRVPEGPEQLARWSEHLGKLGYQNSGIVERHWFKSMYVREPNEVVFELATDGPGFDVDEDIETLGKELVLPPQLESRRSEIEGKLKPLDTEQPKDS